MQGHLTSFVSTLLNGPVQDQKETYREACKVLLEKQRARQGKERLVVVGGESDTVVLAQDVKEDLDEMLGPENFVFETVERGHGFLLDQDACERVVEAICKEWGV